MIKSYFTSKMCDGYWIADELKVLKGEVGNQNPFESGCNFKSVTICIEFKFFTSDRINNMFYTSQQSTKLFFATILRQGLRQRKKATKTSHSLGKDELTFSK